MPGSATANLLQKSPLELALRAVLAFGLALWVSAQISPGILEGLRHYYETIVYQLDDRYWINFTLTYPGDQLYAAAYSSFDPADIGSGYLGDVGGTLTSPQTMGINVAAGVSIYVVVSAVAIGTAAAGSYTLSCSAY